MDVIDEYFDYRCHLYNNRHTTRSDYETLNILDYMMISGYFDCEFCFLRRDIL